VTRTTRAALKWASYNKRRFLPPYSSIRFFHVSEDASDGGDLVGWRTTSLASGDSQHQKPQDLCDYHLAPGGDCPGFFCSALELRCIAITMGA
jgi:hypothetical protein